MFMSVLFACIYVCIMYVPGASGVQITALVPL